MAAPTVAQRWPGRRWRGEQLIWRSCLDGYEAYGEHFYFKIVHGRSGWKVASRRGTLNPLMIIGVCQTMREARMRAEMYGACV